jgi:hypothetical protein
MVIRRLRVAGLQGKFEIFRGRKRARNHRPDVKWLKTAPKTENRVDVSLAVWCVDSLCLSFYKAVVTLELRDAVLADIFMVDGWPVWLAVWLGCRVWLAVWLGCRVWLAFGLT